MNAWSIPQAAETQVAYLLWRLNAFATENFELHLSRL